MQWADDELISFRKASEANAASNTINFVQRFNVHARINACFKRSGSMLSNVKPALIAMLFYRCKFAFMTASNLAFAGTLVESFVLMRLCLENAIYALMIFETPSLASLFDQREDNIEAKRIFTKAFAIRKGFDCVASKDKRLAELFEDFYNRAIEFGAHPNPNAIYGSMYCRDDDEIITIGQVALTDDKLATDHALKTVGQIGLGCLLVFQHIFKAQFELLGIREEIDNLRRYGKL